MQGIESIADHLALNTLVFHGRPFERAFEMTAQLGFRYVEPALIQKYYPEMIDDDFFPVAEGRRLSAMASAAGLKIKSVGVHFNMGDQAEDSAAMVKRIEFAKELGAEIVISNAAVKQNLRGFLDCIDKVTPVLAEYGLVLALENPGCGAPESIIASGGEGALLMETLANPHVRLNYDASNVYSYSRGRILPEEDYQNAAPYSACLHLKQLKKDGERWLFSAVGDGITEYGRILTGIIADYGIPYMALELPLNHMRDRNLRICKNSDFAVVPDTLIREIITDSAEYVAGTIRKQYP